MAAVSCRGTDRVPRDPAVPMHWRKALGGTTLGLWVAHELLLGVGAWVPLAPGPVTALYGLPWFRWDVGLYEQLTHLGYAGSPPSSMAFFPGVPVYLWLTHWPWAALVVMQLAVLALLFQVRALAQAWGLSPRAATLAQALVAFTPATVYYSTVYPETWLAVGLAGMLLAMRAGHPWRAAGWAVLAGTMDPLGLAMGAGAGVWTAVAFVRRDWPRVWSGLIWGTGSVLALALVGGTLGVSIGRPLAFIGEQQAWHSRWLVPGVQIVQALTGRLSLTGGAFLTMLPVAVLGTLGVVVAARRSEWHAATAAIGVILLLIPLSFYSNRLPLAMTALFVSVDLPITVAAAGLLTRRLGVAAVAAFAAWAMVDAVLFAHGWFWG